MTYYRFDFGLCSDRVTLRSRVLTDSRSRAFSATIDRERPKGYRAVFTMRFASGSTLWFVDHFRTQRPAIAWANGLLRRLSDTTAKIKAVVDEGSEK